MSYEIITYTRSFGRNRRISTLRPGTSTTHNTTGLFEGFYTTLTAPQNPARTPDEHVLTVREQRYVPLNIHEGIEPYQPPATTRNLTVAEVDNNGQGLLFPRGRRPRWWRSQLHVKVIQR